MNDCSICKNYEPVTAKAVGQKATKENPDVVCCSECRWLSIKDFVYGYCHRSNGLNGLVMPWDYCSRGEYKEGEE